MAFLEMNGVGKGFGVGKNRAEVLAGIDLKIQEGEFVAIVGYSGSGKTTLVSMAAGLLKPDEGEVILRGERIESPGPDRAVVFQNYSLLPWLTVQGNIALAVDQVFSDWPAEKRRAHVEKHIAMVGLAHAKDRRPRELSGGMRQRVSVARALAMNPRILLLDEPLGALDALTRATLQDEIARIWASDRKTVVMITNDVDEGIYLADRIIPLSAGPKAKPGPAVEVDLPRPRDRKALNHDPRFQAIRREVLGFLLGEGARPKASVTRKLTLPDIEPEDLNAPRSLGGGRRPLRRGEVKSETIEV